MSYTTFFRPTSTIGDIQLDAVISEQHDSTVTLTSNPVERGAAVNDHATIEPKGISVVAGFSILPLGLGGLIFSDIDRPKAIYEQLIKLQEKREPINVQTDLKLYKNMIILSVSTTKDGSTGTTLRITIGMQELIIVDTVTTTLPASKLSTTNKNKAATANRGEVDAPKVDKAQPKTKSMLTKIFK